MITVVVFACVALMAVLVAASYEDERTQTALGCGPKARPIQTTEAIYENEERTRKVTSRDNSRQYPLYTL
jgi:hypothetical protein